MKKIMNFVVNNYSAIVGVLVALVIFIMAAGTFSGNLYLFLIGGILMGITMVINITMIGIVALDLLKD